MQGKFALKDLDPDLVFRLLVVAQGYAPNEPAGGIDPQKGQVTLTLKLHDLDRRDPALVLRGRVVDENHKPVANATIVPYGIRIDERTEQFGTLTGLVDPLAVTNDRGEFRLGVTKKDSPLYLEVNAPFLAPLKTDMLAPGAKAHEISLVSGATVRGKVLKDGKPVVGISLRFVHSDEPGRRKGFHLKIATDSQGAFVFTNVPPNREYTLFGDLESCHGHGSLRDHKVRVGMSSTSEDLGALTMQPGHGLAGRMILADGRPVPVGTRLSIYLFREKMGFADGLATVAGPDGAFAFRGLPMGRYTLEARLADYHLSPKNRSYDSLSSISCQLIGMVDRNIVGLRLLLEPGPQPPNPDPNKLPREEYRKRLKEYRNRCDSVLQGVPAD